MRRIANAGLVSFAALALLWTASVGYGAETQTVAKEEKAIEAKGEGAQQPNLKLQTVCPIMNKKIDKKLYVDANGYRIYVCCKSCMKAVAAHPEKAIEDLRAKGEFPEVRLTICPKCGELRDSVKCCEPEAKKCEKCGLNEGSIGCCKHLKPLKEGESIVLCPKCGEQLGSEKCCKPDTVRCEKCGLIAGSPGCCKLPKRLLQDAAAQSAKPQQVGSGIAKQ